MTKFTLKLLPAADGDCLILSWSDVGPVSHMVVDGGRAGAYPHLKEHLTRIANNGEVLELYVLTHIDADHIEGALAYLKDRTQPIAPKEVWYNGYRQMKGSGRRSLKQGDEYSVALEKLRWPLNRQFANFVASIENAPGQIDIAGLKITMLSPDAAHLKALGDRWDEWRKLQGVEAESETNERMRASTRRSRNPIPAPLVIEDLIGDGKIDSELPNGTSIAFVAEWQSRRVLFGGDAHPDLLTSSLGPLADAEGGRYRVDLLKAPHHGSMNNMSREFIERIDCRQLALSTNGNLHGHPDPQAIARFLHFGSEGPKVLYFNYDTERTSPWRAPEVMARHDFEARYPTDAPGTIEIDLLA